ncbi:enolase-phosphatase E1-like [Scylla paramamosain]|uniref:enolase-phosphatase E1-like n=1 Tax=Scylla paramamosain TaxID=85552 RepID=UPI0030829432
MTGDRMDGERSFNTYMRGECVVENGDILRGPPRTVKVSMGDPDAKSFFCCCWPRGPRFTKVAKFFFKPHKEEPSLQKYTSLETVMYMDGMVFREYWTPGKMAVKVSIKQRRGKKVVLFGRLATFLQEMENRNSEKFVLYVTETSFKIIQKDRPAPGGDDTDAAEKQKNKPLQECECAKRGDDENEVKIDYATSLFNSFKKKDKPVNIITAPEIVKLPPVIPMQTKNVRSFNKDAPAAHQQQRSAPRTVRRDKQASMKPKETKKEKQIVQVQEIHEKDIPCETKNNADEKATNKKDKEDTEEQNHTEMKKESGTMSEVQLVQEIHEKDIPCETKNNADEKATNKKDKEDTEEQNHTEMKKESGTMSEVQLVHENHDENAESVVKNPAEEKSAVWEEYDRNESEETEGDTEDVKSVPTKTEKTDEEEKEYTEKQKVTEKEIKPGKISEMQLVQEKDDEYHEGEEANTLEGKETSVSEDYDAHDTGKKEVVVEDVKSTSPEKDNEDKEIKKGQNFEKEAEKQDVIEKVNLPSITKLLSLTKVIVKNNTRREKIRKAMLLRKKRESVSLGNVKTTSPVEKMTTRKNIGKDQHLKKKVMTCRHKNTAMANVSSKWRWWKASPPTPVKNMTARMKVKKELELRKKTFSCSNYRYVRQLKRNNQTSGEKKNRFKKINLKSVRCKIDTHYSLPSDYKPDLDLKVLESQSPPSGPARVKWAREVAALNARLRSQKQKKGRTSAQSLHHESQAAKHLVTRTEDHPSQCNRENWKKKVQKQSKLSNYGLRSLSTESLLRNMLVNRNPKLDQKEKFFIL